MMDRGRRDFFKTAGLGGLAMMIGGCTGPAESRIEDAPGRRGKATPCSLPGPTAGAVREPDYQLASQWWSDLSNIWTPLGWPDHLCRFSVFWSGMILAEPCLNRRSEQFVGQGAQITFFPSHSGKPDFDRNSFNTHDDGLVLQGWTDRAAPEMWTQWPFDGVVLRQHVFAHVPGGGPTQRGDEPLFAWIRLAVHDVVPGLPQEEHTGVLLRIDRPHLWTSMSNRANVRFKDKGAAYPRALRPEAEAYSAARGLRLLEPDGRVRLAVTPDQACETTFQATPAKDDPTQHSFSLYVRVPLRKGASVDLLLPMLPTDRATFDRELSLGYDGALKEADRYWASLRPRTAAVIRVPEREIGEGIEHSVRFAHVLTEKNPATGMYCMGRSMALTPIPRSGPPPGR